MRPVTRETWCCSFRLTYLDCQTADERLRSGRDVLLKQSVECMVQGGADEIAACI